MKTTKPDMCKLNLIAFNTDQVCLAGKTIRTYGPTFGTVFSFFPIK